MLNNGEECNKKQIAEEIQSLINDDVFYKDSILEGVENLLAEEGIKDISWDELKDYILYVLDCYINNEEIKWDNEREKKILEMISGYIDSEIEYFVHRCEEKKKEEEEFLKTWKTWAEEDKKEEEKYLKALKKEGLL